MAYNGTVALAVTVPERRDYWHENPPPTPCSRFATAFAGFRFPPQIIVIADRSTCTTIALPRRRGADGRSRRAGRPRHHLPLRLRFTPLLTDADRPCRHAVGDRWHVDETYVKVAGQYRLAYHAIDQFGQVIDVFVAPRRVVRAARRCFQ